MILPAIQHTFGTTLDPYELSFRTVRTIWYEEGRNVYGTSHRDYAERHFDRFDAWLSQFTEERRHWLHEPFGLPSNRVGKRDWWGDVAAKQAGCYWLVQDKPFKVWAGLAEREGVLLAIHVGSIQEPAPRGDGSGHYLEIGPKPGQWADPKNVGRFCDPVRWYSEVTKDLAEQIYDQLAKFWTIEGLSLSLDNATPGKPGGLKHSTAMAYQLLHPTGGRVCVEGPQKKSETHWHGCNGHVNSLDNFYRHFRDEAQAYPDPTAREAREFNQVYGNGTPQCWGLSVFNDNGGPLVDVHDLGNRRRESRIDLDDDPEKAIDQQARVVRQLKQFIDPAARVVYPMGHRLVDACIRLGVPASQLYGTSAAA